MWINKLLTVVLVCALLIGAFRVLINRQQRRVIHRHAQSVAKILLAAMSVMALIHIYKRYF